MHDGPPIRRSEAPFGARKLESATRKAHLERGEQILPSEWPCGVSIRSSELGIGVQTECLCRELSAESCGVTSAVRVVGVCLRLDGIKNSDSDGGMQSAESLHELLLLRMKRY